MSLNCCMAFHYSTVLISMSLFGCYIWVNNRRILCQFGFIMLNLPPKLIIWVLNILFYYKFLTILHARKFFYLWIWLLDLLNIVFILLASL